MQLNKKNSIALVIDMQERLLPHMQNADEVKNNCIKLIKGFITLDIPIIVTQQYTKGLGATVSDISENIKDFSYVEKTAFSCYREPNFASKLNNSKKHYVIIMGIESHVCVMQTALDLINNGFIPVVVNNAIDSRKSEDKEVAIWRMRDAGAIITTYESILFELCEKSGSEEFKIISKLVK